jgi:hypothetical protein
MIIGKKSVRALDLANGRPAWKELETGLPSGQGIASRNIYYLPLASGAQSKEPEICAIDTEEGMVVAHTPCKEVPGNLVFFNDLLLSQSVNEIVAYPLTKQSR